MKVKKIQGKIWLGRDFYGDRAMHWMDTEHSPGPSYTQLHNALEKMFGKETSLYITVTDEEQDE